jgi:hypothetical protein
LGFLVFVIALVRPMIVKIKNIKKISTEKLSESSEFLRKQKKY